MDVQWFPRRDGSLYAEQVPLTYLANQFDTPLYVYSHNGLVEGYQAYQQALKGCPHMICYAVKANSNLTVLRTLAQLGAGFDIVSGGELERVVVAGGDTSRVVFSGVGKQCWEIQRALELDIHCFNVESESELSKIQQEAQALGKVAPVSIRVNPDIDAQTHPYISTGLRDNKFGIEMTSAPSVYKQAKAMPNIKVVGVDCHIGSQLTSLHPLTDALDRLLLLVDQLQEMGIILQHLDLGGGLGVAYQGHETPPTPSEYLSIVRERLSANDYHQGLKVIVEPGRSIIAPAGILLTRVEALKKTNHKAFAVVDAAMNDLLRPSLYGAWHEIEPVVSRSKDKELVCDVVGPVCETGDFLGKDRTLRVVEGDLLAVHCTGAYGFGMGSNYNTRCRAAEVMVNGDKALLVRRRETLTELLAAEKELL